VKCWRGTYSSVGPLKGYMISKMLGTPALVVGAQGPVAWAKMAKTYPTYDVTHKKHETQNLPIVLMLTRRLAASFFEDLSTSSLPQLPGTLRGCKGLPNMCTLHLKSANPLGAEGVNKHWWLQAGNWSEIPTVVPINHFSQACNELNLIWCL